MCFIGDYCPVTGHADYSNSCESETGIACVVHTGTAGDDRPKVGKREDIQAVQVSDNGRRNR